METWIAFSAVLATVVVVGASLMAADHLIRHRVGHLVLLVAAVILPLGVSAGGALVGVTRSSRTNFCVDCHEMQAYGQSLFVNNPEALSAVHYQKRLISRDSTCFACHTDYAMFGDVKAKLNGLKHVWVHYVSGPPEKLELYQPYPNHNCLHCHDDARSFLEVPDHLDEMPALRENKKSCLECHEVGHDLEGVKAGNFWNAEAK